MGTKPDLDRLGIFREAAYVTIGDPFRSNKHFEFKTGVVKGRQMFPGPTHAKCGLKPGYFNEFQRVFTGEAYDEPIKRARKEKIFKQKLKITDRQFYPTSSTKKPSGLGSVYGLFEPKIAHFIPNADQTKKIEKIPNFRINPPKKGTGSGYPDVTINKYPLYKSDKFDKTLENLHQENEIHKKMLGGRQAFKIGGNVEEFGPNPYKGEGFVKTRPKAKSPGPRGPIFRPSHPPKDPGGCHAGTINAYPAHSTDKYIDPYKLGNQKLYLKAGIFNSASSFKSMRVESIIDKNIDRSINSSNFNKVTSVF
ncbi:hypothetical protein Ciccas_002543 [Cichlidogyrus casuarinus]|uniref:Cilia-and flagella-associated protein 96 n=1 Tax=Cichlidogyrus casuarinus TaxID=1844966 RepID=A0ABD2QGZ4_9PLAT